MLLVNAALRLCRAMSRAWFLNPGRNAPGTGTGTAAQGQRTTPPKKRSAGQTQYPENGNPCRLAHSFLLSHSRPLGNTARAVLSSLNIVALRGWSRGHCSKSPVYTEIAVVIRTPSPLAGLGSWLARYDRSAVTASRASFALARFDRTTPAHFLVFFSRAVVGRGQDLRRSLNAGTAMASLLRNASGSRPQRYQPCLWLSMS